MEMAKFKEIQHNASVAIEQLQAFDREIREAHAAAQRERRRILTAPPPADDTVGAMQAVIATVSEQWARVSTSAASWLPSVATGS